VLRELKPKFSSGPDGYSAFFLKNIASQIAFPLYLLFNQSFCCSDIPSVWRQAVVIPVFKKGNASECNNYRPISLTCICCKLMETIIKKQVIDFLLRHGSISKQQHGFLSKHSTCSQIIECVNDWSLALNNRKQVDVVYIDFCKAFDSVVHKKLIHKLESLGIRGKLLLWIEAFLSNRTQAVKIAKAVSRSVDVISGVPQGSVLGPLLFLVYINDIVDVFDSKVQIKLFADDAKIYVVVNDITDCEHMQYYIDKLVSWANCWQLKISIPKCACLHLGTRRVNYQYLIGGESLPDVDSMVDLGVTVSTNLKFSKHISCIVNRAHQRACLILRCFKCRDPETLCRAFVVYIRPLLEYCSQVWSPCYLTDICKLERVQRQFTKRLKGMRNLSYGMRLEKLNLETLELRRLKFDLIFVYKIMHGLVSVDNNIFEFSNMVNLRGHSCKMTKPVSNINCRLFSFASRVVDVWNILPQTAIEADTLDEFKEIVDNVNFCKFLHVKL
jgi:ribonucleases P/MRP protein subunit RPP40